MNPFSFAKIKIHTPKQTTVFCYKIYKFSPGVNKARNLLDQRQMQFRVVVTDKELSIGVMEKPMNNKFP